MELKLKLSGNNLNVQLTNTAGEPIYTYQVDSLNVELDVAKLIESSYEIMQMVFAAVEKTSTENGTEKGAKTILGYQFFNDAGFPVGYVQPTLEAAEEIAQFEETGRFYSLEKTKQGQMFLRYQYRKTARE